MKGWMLGVGSKKHGVRSWGQGAEGEEAPRLYCLLSTVYCLLFLTALLAGCNSAEAAPAPNVSTSAATVTPTPALAISSRTPLPAEQAVAPVRIAIPALDFAAPVEPMAWQVTQVAGERRAVWQVPLDKAGWHINSVPAGAQGNLIISGHHLQGEAVFARIANGEVTVGQQILVTDEKGRTFVYQVTEISPPIPQLGATAADQARAAAYIAPSAQAKLTLMTGWPTFSNTHYLFVVAQFVGRTS
ncbi:MAG: class F sortase [Caldilineaceae bacterium]